MCVCIKGYAPEARRSCCDRGTISCYVSCRRSTLSCCVLFLQKHSVLLVHKQNVLLLYKHNDLLLQKQHVLLLQKHNVLLLQKHNVLLLQKHLLTTLASLWEHCGVICGSLLDHLGITGIHLV